MTNTTNAVSYEEILKRKVLIIDDEEANLLLLQTLLQREGYKEIHALSDPTQAIEKLIEQERASFSSSETGADAFSQLFAEFQELQVNLEFAEKSYLSAQAAYDLAQAEAVRKSRYLATYIKPTLAETAEYPRRLQLVLLTFGALILSWSILAMIYYSLRDRR